jgi:gamma-polyglutamate synthase
MPGFLILLALTALFTVYLILESIIFNRKIKQIPMRISVSGTRGKTSITRTLASVYQAHGIRVLAKTTGSEAMFILPDGTTRRIRRKGLTTILEQKNLIRLAVKLKAECLITEIMSIHPENHRVETNKLIKPGLTILSNFRADHTDVVGESLREISELFINDIFPGSKVIVSEDEMNEFIHRGIKQKKAQLIVAQPGTGEQLRQSGTVSVKQLNSNLALIIAAAHLQGIPDNTILQGILDTHLDIGQTDIFRHVHIDRKIWLVNAFAANDPVSTVQIIQLTNALLTPEMTSPPEIVGLIALRSDRGERSRQWLNYLKGDGKDLFSRTYVTGAHSHIFKNKLKNCTRLNPANPGIITRQIIDETKGDIVIYGITNIHGTGIKLLSYWKTMTDNKN